MLPFHQRAEAGLLAALAMTTQERHCEERSDEAIQPKERGFTLVEMMVVIVIIGLLATIVIINVMPAADRAAVTKARADISTLEQGDRNVSARQRALSDQRGGAAGAGDGKSYPPAAQRSVEPALSSMPRRARTGGRSRSRPWARTGKRAATAKMPTSPADGSAERRHVARLRRRGRRRALAADRATTAASRAATASRPRSRTAGRRSRCRARRSRSTGWRWTKGWPRRRRRRRRD